MKKILTLFGFSILCALLAEPIKSNLAASNIAFADSKEQLENPYIQDGLIAMWDGEWNVGLGTHDDKSPEWKNLVEGGVDLVLGDYGKWDYNSLLCLGGRIPAHSTKRGEILTVHPVDLSPPKKYICD